MSWVVDQRKKLSDDIKAYLASGKQIQQIPKGYSKGTQSTAHNHCVAG